MGMRSDNCHHYHHHHHYHFLALHEDTTIPTKHNYHILFFGNKNLIDLCILGIVNFVLRLVYIPSFTVLRPIDIQGLEQQKTISPSR